jgi:hypothetical protein
VSAAEEAGGCHNAKRHLAGPAVDELSGHCQALEMRSSRPSLVAALAALSALIAAPALAEEPAKLVLRVGEQSRVGGYAGMCDDLSVATITLDASAVITALKPGTTTCSSRFAGGRQVLRVVVEAPDKQR